MSFTFSTPALKWLRSFWEHKIPPEKVQHMVECLIIAGETEAGAVAVIEALGLLSERKLTIPKAGDRVEAHGQEWMVLSVVAAQRVAKDSAVHTYLCLAVEWREYMPGWTSFNEGFGVPDKVTLIQVVKIGE